MMNLSLGERPVRLVYPTSAPLEATLASSRRMACSTRAEGERLKCVLPSDKSSATSLTCIVVAIKVSRTVAQTKRNIVTQSGRPAKCRHHANTRSAVHVQQRPWTHIDAVCDDEGNMENPTLQERKNRG